MIPSEGRLLIRSNGTHVAFIGVDVPDAEIISGNNMSLLVRLGDDEAVLHLTPEPSTNAIPFTKGRIEHGRFY